MESYKVNGHPVYRGPSMMGNGTASTVFLYRSSSDGTWRVTNRKSDMLEVKFEILK